MSHFKEQVKASSCMIMRSGEGVGSSHHLRRSLNVREGERMEWNHRVGPETILKD